MYYAIKSIDGNTVNKIEDDWSVCKPLVIGHNSIYKSFQTKEDAYSYLNENNVSTEGYEVIKDGINIIYAKYLFTRFKDNDNGYTCSVYQTKAGKRVTCVGYNLPVNKNITYKLNGEYRFNKKHGNEFSVNEYSEVIEDTKEGIIAYLSSGVIKGVGEKKAKAIYDAFKMQTLEVLEKEPEKLALVKGFSEASAKKATEQLNDNKGAREVTRYLLKFGISQKYAIELFNRMGRRALAYVKEHPYSLCNFEGVSFEDADLVAADNNITKNNSIRVTFGIYHVLKENEVSGNTGMEWSEFSRKALSYLGISEYDLAKQLLELKKDNKIKLIKLSEDGVLKSFVFTNEAIEREENIARNIIRIRDAMATRTIKNIDEKIKKLEGKYGFTLDVAQKLAIKLSLSDKPFVVINGGPGTGKTTTIKFIAEIYEEENPNVIFLAPTGRAARRMRETSGRSAETIHSKCGITPESFNNELEPDIEDAAVVVDEFSMTDVYTADVLFSKIASGCRVIIVGDPNQLPSVGPGAVLRDLINSNAVSVVELNTIHRQDEEGTIYSNCKKIKEGNADIEVGEDFEIIETSNMEDVKNIMAELYVNSIAENGLLNTLCLCPFRKHIAGLEDMNATLQNLINKEQRCIKAHGEIFKPGDPVMHLKNEIFASNGDIGVIKDINEDEKIIYVNINDKLITYEKEDFRKLTLAYASTIHKSQGSEASHVICEFTNFHKNMLFRNMPYVAFSRGKIKVTVVGEKSAIVTAIKNERKNKRVTLTGRYLRLYDNQFVYV